ncbi:ABC transporter ATP-binding protein [Clostridiaceae bacterium AF02-42]|uniref:ABC transporter ATP-binding protein n=1 Tax=Clostridium sp. AF28-12 TaxID=2305241 RepID=UPI000E3F37A5|nr:ABC transporter ATP-binding protein [Clostridium sp. AF28-12]RGD99964.1 ABC transporter ATP-binding protein [Clostridium sp. AF28-12]RGE02753.1 ABC transporter ATP-binding protein [Clostridiaceae bacterium AF02-42]
MSGLVLRNINKTFPGDQQAIRDFNLEVKDREFLILVGPTACGKSTLLRMIGGLEEITSGSLMIDGMDMTDADPKERNVAMLFKNSVLYPGMSVEDNLTFSLRMAKMPAAEIARRVDETVGILKIEGILEKMPEELSAADTYRVLLGRALMRRPGILLLDRTIAEADPDVQELMRKEFANINRELGITVIYATDNQKTAMALGTRTIVMNDGEICQEDSAQNIYDHPESLFVAGFFGTPRMDLSIARVLEENGNIVLEFASGKIRLSGEKAEQLKKLDYVGKEVFTGVRPEKIVPAKDGKGEITGEILGSEEIEDATYIRFRVGENEFLAKASDGEKPSGKKMSFAISGDDVYLFDKETEKIIKE